MFMLCVDILVCCFRFSYHRTEGQELSMQCLGRRTKASVEKLLYYHENFYEECSPIYILFMVHFKSFSYWYWGFLGLIVVLFYVMNCLTPYFSDDWHYCMMIGPNGEEDRRIENILDVIVSNYYHYFQVNGRFIPHFFLMTFDALLGKPFFNVFSAVLFGLYLHLMVLNFVKRREDAMMGLALATALTILFMCGFKYEFLWMSGAFNYEFVAVLVLLFHYIFRKGNFSKKWMLLLFLYGVLVGWTNEAVVIGLSCVYLYESIKYGRGWKWSQWVLFSGFIVGGALCIFAPGSISRALDGKEATRTLNLSAFLWGYLRSLFKMYNLRIFFLMLALCAIVKRWLKRWLLAIVVSILFVAFTWHDSGQSRFGIEWFSLIVILCVFPYQMVKRKVSIIVLSATVIYLLFCIPYCIQNYQNFKFAEKQIKETRNGIISNREVHPPLFIARMIVFFIGPEDSDGFFVYDGWVKHYYEREDVALVYLPERFVQEIHQGQINEIFDLETNNPFYACRLNNESQPTCAKYVLKESFWSSFPLLNKMERFVATEMSVEHMLVLEIEGVRYLLVKKNTMIQDRVIDIKYE